MAEHRQAAGPAVGGGWARPFSWFMSLLVLALLVWAARHIHWSDVFAALMSFSPSALLMAVPLVFLSYLLYCSYDLLSRACLRHRVPAARVIQIAFVSYAFNLNFGALIGGVAMRLRLYARAGLSAAMVGQVVAMSMASNWMGYGLVAGLALSGQSLVPPAHWHLSSGTLQAIGLGLLLTAALYVVLCASLGRRTLRWRQHRFRVPSWPIALAQVALASANWLTMAAVMTVLFRDMLSFSQVLPVLLIAAVAGVITHVPAGLGVLEAVFIALLVPTLQQATVLATLVVYRTLYYLIPLVLAGLVYLWLESTRSAPARPEQSG